VREARNLVASVGGDLLLVVTLRHLLGRRRYTRKRPCYRTGDKAGGDDAEEQRDATGEEQPGHEVAPGAAYVAFLHGDHRLQRWREGKDAGSGTSRRVEQEVLRAAVQCGNRVAQFVVDLRRRLREDLGDGLAGQRDRKSTRLNSSHVKNSYAVFCLTKK